MNTHVNTNPTMDAYHAGVQLLESLISPPGKGPNYMAGEPMDQSFFLERTQRLFDAVGNPEKSGMQFVHVTGTSGKGSTSTMIYQCLLAAGKDVAMYNSPYVTTAAENIHARGRLIEPDAFAELAQEIVPIAKQIGEDDPEWKPSYADAFFAIAMKYFESIGIEWVVLEVGCGGRFDKTNIIPAPAAAVITPVGIDHVNVLGDTVDSVAWHKAGIIKPGTTVFSAKQLPEALNEIQQEAEDHEVEVHVVDTAWDGPIAMSGKHQAENAALAAAVATHLGIDAAAIQNGLTAARLPARVEIMQKDPLVIIDGGHSEPKVAALVDALTQLKATYNWNKLHLLFSVKEGKDATAMAKLLTPLADTVTLSEWQLPGFASVAATEMVAQFTEAGATDITIMADGNKAIEYLLSQAEPIDAIVIAGSLYFAGELRGRWYSEEEILRQGSVFPQ